MRGLKRQQQSVYCAKVTEEIDGIDTIPKYSNLELHRFSVSATAGTPAEIFAGIVPDYDRYITSFDRSFTPEEGDVFWIDVSPAIDESGVPTIMPDYRLKKILDTQKGNVARYGIVKIGVENVQNY